MDAQSEVNEELRIQTISPDGHELTWYGAPGRTYFLQECNNLSTWRYAPMIISGEDAPVSLVRQVAGETRWFYRLRSSNLVTNNPVTADFDGDRVGNMTELLQGTDPLVALDVDDNGFLDDWEIRYFGNVGLVDPDEDSEGDGLTNGEEFAAGASPWAEDTDGDGLTDQEEVNLGTSAWQTNTDGDAADDAEDLFPTDPRRIEEVPEVGYAALNLSENITFPVINMALAGHGDSLAFYYQEATNYKACRWTGTTGLVTVPIPQMIDYYDEMGEMVPHTFLPVGITAGGSLAGNLVTATSGHAALCGSAGLPYDARWEASCEGVTPEGTMWGTVPVTYVGNSRIRVPYVAHFIGDQIFPQMTHTTAGEDPNQRVTLSWSRGDFTPQRVSYNGRAAVGAYTAPGASTVNSIDGPYSLPSFANGAVSAGTWQPGGEPYFEPLFSGGSQGAQALTIDNYRQVIGTSQDTPPPYGPVAPGAGSFFVWSETASNLYDRIPQKYREQVKVTNVIATSPLGVVLLQGAVLKGPGNGTWVTHYLLLHNEQLWIAQTGDKTPTQVADNYVLAAMQAPAAGQPKDAFFLLPPEIQARDGKINEGFDPPLIGDTDINGVSDEDDWVPWTRVAKGGPFQTNELTQLVTPSDTVAQMLEVVPAADSVALIEVPTRYPNTATYPLTIRGKPSLSTTVDLATVEVRLKNGSPATVLARLKMWVVPNLPTAHLKFFFVADSRWYDGERAGQPTGTKIRDSAGGPGPMADDVDQRFNQAGASMALLEATEHRDIAFLGPPAGYIDETNNTGPYWHDEALEYYENPLIPQLFTNLAGGHINTVLVHRLIGKQTGVYNPETRLCFISYDKWYPGPVGAPSPYPYWNGPYGSPGEHPEHLFQPDSRGRDGTRWRTFSHEVGHALLPVRNRPGGGEENLPPVNGWAGGHDYGPAPVKTDALMRRGKVSGDRKGKWMRHEDWKTATEELKRRMGIQ